MGYQVVKVLNNNSVLAQSSEGNQVVLMSKGVGYGKKTGDPIRDGGEDQKTFYILDSSQNVSKLKKLGMEQGSVELVTREIVEIAKKRLGLENENLYGALLDHITFAIECLQMGLPIDNPFVGEISILYREEYETAQIAAAVIKERLSVEIGEAETGFIALHLCSARRNKHIRTAIKNTRVFSEILNMVSRYAGKSIDSSSAMATSFLLSLNQLIQSAAAGRQASMKLKNQVRFGIPHDWNAAEEITGYIARELNVSLGEDAVAFLAVDIHKLVQM